MSGFSRKTLLFSFALAISMAGFLFFHPAHAFAANRYWVGGTATWDSTAGTKWATVSNGSGGAAVPTASDTVFFDGSSGSGTVTTSGTTTDLARSIDFTGFTGTFNHAASTTVSIGDGSGGSFTAGSGMTYTIGDPGSSLLNFVSTTTGNTVTTNGKTMPSMTFNGSGGSWQLQDNLTATGANITLSTGTLNTNGKTVAASSFEGDTENTRTLTLGSSAINLTGAWLFGDTTNLTMTANTATVTLTGNGAFFRGGSKNYNGMSLAFTGTGDRQDPCPTIIGANTFGNITVNGGAGFNYCLTINDGNQTITGTLTLTGQSISNRLEVHTGTYGTNFTLTAAAVSLANVDFQDITGAGAGTWSGTSVGDELGNSGITFTSPQTLYWIGHTGDWSDSSKWSLSSGGSAASLVPLPQDTVRFDANSFSADGQQTETDMFEAGKNIDWTGVSHAAVWRITGLGPAMFGSLTLNPSVTYSGSAGFIMQPRSAASITSNSDVFASGSAVPLDIEPFGATITLNDDFSVTTGVVFDTAGTFDANGFNVTTPSYFIRSGSVTNMGSGTWTLNGTGNVWNGSGGTVNGQTSTVVINDTTSAAKVFNGLGATFNNITFAGDNITVTGSNTFATMAVNNAGCTNGLILTNGTTQTVTGFTTNADAVSASCGSHGTAKLLSDSAGSAATLSKSSGTVSVDYMSIKDSIATGGAAWFAGANSTSVSGNSGWVFTAPVLSISGTVYSDEGSTALTTTPVVRIKINGAGSYSTTAAGNGTFSISNVTMSSGDIVTEYLDGDTEKAVTVTRSAGSSISGLNLYQNFVIVRSEDGSALTNTNLDQYDSGQDSDIQFTVTSGALTVASNNTLLLNTASTYTPGGDITTPSLKQTNGTFNGGSGSIIVSGNLTISGGTFNSTSGTLTVDNDGNFTHTAGGTFNHNNGTVLLGSSCGGPLNTIDVNSTETFYNLTFNSGCGTIISPTISTGDTLIVANTLTFGLGDNFTGLFGGSIEARGNIVVGSVSGGGSTAVSMLVTGDQSITSSGGTMPPLTINKSSGTVSVSGDLGLEGLTLTDGAFTSTTGTLTLEGNGNFTITGGTFTHNNGTVELGNGCGGVINTDVNVTATFYNLIFNNGCGNSETIAGGDTLIATNNLTFSGQNAVTGGTVEARGNVTVTSTNISGDTTPINFTGTANQVLIVQSSGVLTSGTLTINKSSGTVTLGSNLTTGTSQNLTVTSGTLDTGGYALAGGGSATFSVANGATFVMSGASSYPTGFGTITYGATSTERYAQSTATTIINATYGNLELKPGANPYSYSRAIVIDHTKVPNTDQTNFPVLVSGTYTYLKTVGNGGKVQNSSGYDVGFFSDSSCSTKLNWETEKYVGTTGEVSYWVNIPTVSHTADTTFYLCYGSSGISSDQSNPTAVWDSNYNLVYHLPNGTSLTTNDSTTNANNGTNHNTTATTGQIDGAGSFDGSSSYIDSGTAVARGTTVTVEAWIKLSALNAIQEIVCRDNSVRLYQFRVTSSNQIELIPFIGGNPAFVDGGTTLTTGVWYHVVAVTNGTNGYVYVNGNQDGTTSTGNLDTGVADNTYIGSRLAGATLFNGIMDEVRISNVARSADWIKTEYNNENSPSTFYTLGSEGTPAGITFTLPATVTTIPGNLVIGDGTNAGTVTAATNNPAITVSGNLTVNNSATFTAGSGAINLLGNLTLASGATWTKGSGTTTFKAGTTQTWTDSTSGQDLGNVEVSVGSSGSGAVTLIAHNSDAGDGIGLTNGASMNTTGADFIIAVINYYSTQGATPISDSKGNTWVPIGSPVGSNPTSQVFYSIPTSVGSGDTFSSTADYVGVSVAAFHGVAQSSPIDQTENNTSCCSATLQPGSLTPSVNNELWITAFGQNLTGGAPTISAPFAADSITDHIVNNYAAGIAWQIQTTATAENPTWTVNSGGPNVAWGVVVKSAPSTAPTTLNLGSSVKASTVTIDASQTLSANGSNTLTLTGAGLTNNGTFTASTGTVSLTNASTTAIGGSSSTTFNNFTDTVAGSTITFANDAGGTTPLYTFSGTVTITGAGGNHITITSDNQPTNKWLVHFASLQTTITHVTVSYSDCDGTSSNANLDSDSTNGTNNGACWAFNTFPAGFFGGGSGSAPVENGSGSQDSTGGGGQSDGGSGGSDGGGGSIGGGGQGGGGGGAAP